MIHTCKTIKLTQGAGAAKFAYPLSTALTQPYFSANSMRDYVSCIHNRET
jgi:hypothetical protein